MADVESVHRSFLAVDVESSGGRDGNAFVVFRKVLFESLREAFESSRIDWDRCVRADRGDGMIVTVPPEFPKPRLIHPLIANLAEHLRHHNREAAPSTRIRLRAAVHAGDVRIDDYGVTGQPKVLLARLLEAKALRDALAAAPDSVTVALIASDVFYRDVITQGHLGINADDFAKVAVREKETSVVAWLKVPGYVATAQPQPAKAAQQEGPGGAGIVFQHSQVEVHGDLFSGDKFVR